MALDNMFDPDTAPFIDVYQKRNANGPDHPDFINYAPYEHQAFARGFIEENPWIGPPALALASPAYQVAKLPALMPYSQRLGIVGEGASPSSIDQLIHEYRGIGQGITNNLASLFRKR